METRTNAELERAARRAFASAVWAAVEAGRAAGLPYAEMGSRLWDIGQDVRHEEELTAGWDRLPTTDAQGGERGAGPDRYPRGDGS
jgi:hypothetical protein